MVDKTSIPNQTVNLEASNRSTAVTPKSIFDGNKAPNFLKAPAVQDLDPHLNPNYNFENFIEGYSNKLSRSVAEAVAQKPGGTAFNPLFLYGSVRSGEKHTWQTQSVLKSKKFILRKEYCTYRHICSRYNIRIQCAITRRTIS